MVQWLRTHRRALLTRLKSSLMQLSIIIPTYNRSQILEECLLRLAEQHFVKNEFELIVVDDGSTDDTKKVVQNFQKKRFFPLMYLFQKNQGQGIARNKGIVRAKGKIVVFIGDDILVRPDFLKEHIEFHRKYPKENEAVLGLTLWDPRLEMNPFMEFMTKGALILGRFGGHQFAYDKLIGKQMADFNFFYTSNISLKRSLLLKYPFDEDFASYGWEDIELGYRLTKFEKLKLHYNNKAVGYHYHPMDESSLENRMKAIGKSVHIFHRKHPELNKVPKAWKRFVFQILSSSFFIRLLNNIRKKKAGKWHYLYYYFISKRGFLKGLREGLKRV